ncbi:MAG: ArdC-like ssDNA-binding domain-containing protein, partial [Chloroflexota bacterium]|nr:ArdC-like ssDNA-binding domain-containing protein [Chloroflexota bacterium]
MASSTQREHMTAAREKLAAMTTELMQSDRWQSLLRAAGTFHHYSLNNQYLIAHQCPHASYLKGFKGWLELGRVVRKGETSIRIMAPRPYAVPTIDKDGNQGEDARMTFAMVSVFDYGQTDPIDGHPNPFTIPERLSVAGDPEA